jgi:hypothetical protein
MDAGQGLQWDATRQAQVLAALKKMVIRILNLGEYKAASSPAEFDGTLAAFERDIKVPKGTIPDAWNAETPLFGDAPSIGAWFNMLQEGITALAEKLLQLNPGLKEFMECSAGPERLAVWESRPASFLAAVVGRITQCCERMIMSAALVELFALQAFTLDVDGMYHAE